MYALMWGNSGAPTTLDDSTQQGRGVCILPMHGPDRVVSLTLLGTNLRLHVRTGERTMSLVLGEASLNAAMAHGLCTRPTSWYRLNCRPSYTVNISPTGEIQLNSSVPSLSQCCTVLQEFLTSVTTHEDVVSNMLVAEDTPSL